MATVHNLADRQRVLPEFEGQRVDRFKVTFSGNVELDPSDPSDHKLIEALKLGADVRLTVDGTIKSRPHKVTLDGEGYAKTVMSEAAVSVHSVNLRKVEQLSLAIRREDAPDPLGLGEEPGEPEGE